MTKAVPFTLQFVWLIAVVALLHLSSLWLLKLWIEAGFSRQGLGVVISLIIIFVMPVMATVWIVQKLGRRFGLSPVHWGVPLVLAPVAWSGLFFANVFED